MVSKRKRNHIEKAMSNSKGARQILVTESPQQQQQPTLYDNEFTIHKPIEKALKGLVIKAREIEVNKKQLVNSVAFEIENELKKMNRPELICHISDVMLSALRRNKVNWSIAYLRKTLPEKYKDPTKRQSALTRFQRAGPPGTPPDTGKTAEELETSLNRKSIVGKYTVYAELELDNNAGIFVQCVEDPNIGGDMFDCDHLPVIVNVDALNQTATVELDKDEHLETLKYSSQKQDSSKPKGSTKKAKK